jgi:hypothetical protein
MRNTTTKKRYQKPTVSDVGSVVDRTLGESTGSKLDANFPTGTPFGDLTFS